MWCGGGGLINYSKHRGSSSGEGRTVWSVELLTPHTSHSSALTNDELVSRSIAIHHLAWLNTNINDGVRNLSDQSYLSSF